MSDTYAQFEKRINRVARKHKALAAGYSAEITDDGLITLTPNRTRAYTRMQMLGMTIIAFFVLKAAAIAFIGPDAYQSSVDALAAGSFFEKSGAFFLQPGAITSSISHFFTVFSD